MSTLELLPISVRLGKMGHTHIRLAPANADVLTGALRTAWKLRMEMNAKTRARKRSAAARGGPANTRRAKR